MSPVSLDLLASPRRREILRLVWRRERSAGEIHRELGDVTFGAVSQQLRGARRLRAGGGAAPGARPLLPGPPGGAGRRDGEAGAHVGRRSLPTQAARRARRRAARTQAPTRPESAPARRNSMSRPLPHSLERADPDPRASATSSFGTSPSPTAGPPGGGKARAIDPRPGGRLTIRYPNSRRGGRRGGGDRSTGGAVVYNFGFAERRADPSGGLARDDRRSPRIPGHPTATSGTSSPTPPSGPARAGMALPALGLRQRRLRRSPRSREWRRGLLARRLVGAR